MAKIKKNPEAPDTPAGTVKVFKKANDSMVSFCGATMQTDEDGREFFELADDLKEMVDTHRNLTWPEDTAE